MTDFMNFGAPPPAPSGFARLHSHLRGAVAGGFVVTVTLLAAQLGLPDGWKPFDIMGRATGRAEREEIKAKQDAKVEFERRVADGVAQAQAKAQADLAAIQAAIDARSKSLEGMSITAVFADLGCIGGRAVAANTQPSLGADWRRANTGGDWHSAAQTVANVTCGLGDTLRQEVTRSQLDVVRTTAAARGMPMTDGATIPAAVASGPGGSLDPATAPAHAVPHRAWTNEQRAQLIAYAEHQSDAVRTDFIAGIDTHYGLTPEWFDRVAAYRYDHP